MTQIFTGELIPVTAIEATPNVVLKLKLLKHGYNAIQVGFDDVLSNKPAADM